MASHLTPGEHSFASSNGRTLAYSVHTRRREHSAKDDILVVQCPAWGLGFRYLVLGLQPLQDEYTLVFLHPRGTGGSTNDTIPSISTSKGEEDNNDVNNDNDDEGEGEMTLFNFAHDLDRLRLHLQLCRLPTLLGHSNGGTVALAYAQLFPHRVANLILLDHRLLRPGRDRDDDNDNDNDNEDDDDERVSMRLLSERSADERYASAYAAYRATPGPSTDEDFTRFIGDIIPLYFYRPERHAAAFRDSFILASATDAPMSLRLYRRVQRGIRRSDMRDMMQRKLRDVAARTLIIFGREDAQCTTANADATKRGIPHAHVQVDILDQCGHFPWIEKPDETFAAIRRFLGRY